MMEMKTTIIINGRPGNDGNKARKVQLVYFGENGSKKFRKSMYYATGITKTKINIVI